MFLHDDALRWLGGLHASWTFLVLQQQQNQGRGFGASGVHLAPPGGLGCCPFWGGCSVVVAFLFIVTPIAGVCNCSMFCCALLCVHSSIAVVLVGRRELVALLGLSSWCLVIVGRLFLAVPRGCLQFVIVVFTDHTHLLFPKDHSLVTGLKSMLMSVVSSCNCSYC